MDKAKFIVDVLDFYESEVFDSGETDDYNIKVDQASVEIFDFYRDNRIKLGFTNASKLARINFINKVLNNTI